MMWWAALHYKHDLPYLSLLQAILPQHAAAPLSFHITPRSNTPAIAWWCKFNEGLSAIYKGVDRQKAKVPCRICLPRPCVFQNYFPLFVDSLLWVNSEV